MADQVIVVDVPRSKTPPPAIKEKLERGTTQNIFHFSASFTR